MKIKILILLISINCYTQPKKEINLPEGGKDISIKQLTHLFSLYITKNQEVYNDDRRLEYFEDIEYSVIDQKNKIIEPWIPQKILLYADEKVYYKFIDIIKTHIPFSRWIYYMTGDMEGFTATSFRLNTYLENDFSLEEITTLEENIEKEEQGIEFLELPPGLANPWWVDAEKAIYSENKQEIIKVLQEHPHDVIVVSKDKTLKNRGHTINNNELKRLLKLNKVLFLSFDHDIYFNDYLWAIQQIQKQQILFEKKKEDKAFIIEISFKLEKSLKDLNIQLN